MINKVILVGNLGGDPEVRRLDNGIAVAKITVATNESYKDKEGQLVKMTEWHNVVLWRGLAEVAEKYLKKGKQVYVEGKLTTRKWQDKDGNNRYTTEVVGNTVKMLGRADESGSGFRSNFPSADSAPPQSQNNYSAPASNAASTTETSSQPQTEEVTDGAGDDLPF